MRKGRGSGANEVAEVRIVASKGGGIMGIIIVYYHSTIYIRLPIGISVTNDSPESVLDKHVPFHLKSS